MDTNERGGVSVMEDFEEGPTSLGREPQVIAMALTGSSDVRPSSRGVMVA